MSTVLKTTIKLRKDTADNYAKVAGTLVPLDGEVCLVDTGTTGLRIKVGNGRTAIGALSYIDDDSTFKKAVIIGRYKDGKFYTNPDYTGEVTLYGNQLYLDYITKYIYFYKDSALTQVETLLPAASTETAGILKLYNTKGQNTDGTITQKFFTDSINGIAFGVENSDNATECLVLNKPWTD